MILRQQSNEVEQKLYDQKICKEAATEFSRQIQWKAWSRYAQSCSEHVENIYVWKSH